MSASLTRTRRWTSLASSRRRLRSLANMVELRSSTRYAELLDAARDAVKQRRALYEQMAKTLPDFDARKVHAAEESRGEEKPL